MGNHKPAGCTMENDIDTGFVAACAVDYAIGRMTYAPYAVIEWCKRHWQSIAPGHRQTIMDHVEHDMQRLNAAQDRDPWIDFWKWMKTNG